MVLRKLRNIMTHRKHLTISRTKKFNIEALQDTTTQWLFNERLKTKITDSLIKQEQNVDDSWYTIKNILEAAKEALGTRIVGNATKHKSTLKIQKYKDSDRTQKIRGGTEQSEQTNQGDKERTVEKI
ncbi:hypothetical protein HHI36_013965 [Cryptolaemus montrouzieri]|uniref:Uncharacterized protein n=1 Tax=Cryptolaemus montrouzieri TaxID=559131 RepID=A0ABD2N236_9CUCU